MMMKIKTSQLILLGGLTVLPMLAGCGYRGGLERPDPLFRELPPLEEPEAETPDAPPAAPEVIIRERNRDAAPVEEVISEPLDDPDPIDEDE